MQARLLVQIKEATVEEMPEDELENMYPLAAPPANPKLRPGSKRPREGEPEAVT